MVFYYQLNPCYLSIIFSTISIQISKDMKKRPTDDESDEFDVDEPEEFEESGSDWDPDEEVLRHMNEL